MHYSRRQNQYRNIQNYRDQAISGCPSSDDRNPERSACCDEERLLPTTTPPEYRNAVLFMAATDTYRSGTRVMQDSSHSSQGDPSRGPMAGRHEWWKHEIVTRRPINNKG